MKSCLKIFFGIMLVLSVIFLGCENPSSGGGNPAVEDSGNQTEKPSDDNNSNDSSNNNSNNNSNGNSNSDGNNISNELQGKSFTYVLDNMKESYVFNDDGSVEYFEKNCEDEISATYKYSVNEEMTILLFEKTFPSSDEYKKITKTENNLTDDTLSTWLKEKGFSNWEEFYNEEKNNNITEQRPYRLEYNDKPVLKLYKSYKSSSITVKENPSDDTKELSGTLYSDNKIKWENGQKSDCTVVWKPAECKYEVTFSLNGIDYKKSLDFSNEFVEYVDDEFVDTLENNENVLVAAIKVPKEITTVNFIFRYCTDGRNSYSFKKTVVLENGQTTINVGYNSDTLPDRNYDLIIQGVKEANKISVGDFIAYYDGSTFQSSSTADYPLTISSASQKVICADFTNKNLSQNFTKLHKLSGSIIVDNVETKGLEFGEVLNENPISIRPHIGQISYKIADCILDKRYTTDGKILFSYEIYLPSDIEVILQVIYQPFNNNKVTRENFVEEYKLTNDTKQDIEIPIDYIDTTNYYKNKFYIARVDESVRGYMEFIDDENGIFALIGTSANGIDYGNEYIEEHSFTYKVENRKATIKMGESFYSVRFETSELKDDTFSINGVISMGDIFNFEKGEKSQFEKWTMELSFGNSNYSKTDYLIKLLDFIQSNGLVENVDYTMNYETKKIILNISGWSKLPDDDTATKLTGTVSVTNVIDYFDQLGTDISSKNHFSVEIRDVDNNKVVLEPKITEIKKTDFEVEYSYEMSLQKGEISPFLGDVEVELKYHPFGENNEYQWCSDAKNVDLENLTTNDFLIFINVYLEKGEPLPETVGADDLAGKTFMYEETYEGEDGNLETTIDKYIFNTDGTVEYIYESGKMKTRSIAKYSVDSEKGIFNLKPIGYAFGNGEYLYISLPAEQFLQKVMDGLEVESEEDLLEILGCESLDEFYKFYSLPNEAFMLTYMEYQIIGDDLLLINDEDFKGFDVDFETILETENFNPGFNQPENSYLEFSKLEDGSICLESYTSEEFRLTGIVNGNTITWSDGQKSECTIEMPHQFEEFVEKDGYYILVCNVDFELNGYEYTVIVRYYALLYPKQ